MAEEQPPAEDPTNAETPSPDAAEQPTEPVGNEEAGPGRG